MRILLAHNRSLERPTGIISHIRNLARELTKRGHEVEVVTKGKSMHFVQDEVEYCQYARIPISVKGFDVVHAHDIRTSLLLTRDKMPSICRIITSHGVYPDPSFHPRPWQSASVTGNAKINLHLNAVRIIGFVAFRTCDKVIAVSKFIKNKLEETYSLCGSKIVIIPNGINIEEFSRPSFDNLEKKWDLGKNAILFVKPYDPRKGFHLMIKALQEVRQDFPHFTLIAVGPRPDGKYGEYIERLIYNSDIKKNIIFTGWVYGEDLISLYHQSDFVAMPSVYEAFGITALEAAACSKPVVGFRIGGLKEVVEDKKTGILVVPNDINALAHWTRVLLEDRELCKALGSNARRKARKYEWTRIAAIVEEIYKSVALE